MSRFSPVIDSRTDTSITFQQFCSKSPGVLLLHNCTSAFSEWNTAMPGNAASPPSEVCLPLKHCWLKAQETCFFGN